MDSSIVFARLCQWAPHLKHASLSPPKSTSQSAQPFFHISRQRVPILYNGPPLPHQNCPFAGGSGPRVIQGSLGTPESTSQTATWLVQLFLQAHNRDRRTHTARYSVYKNRLHLRTQYCDVDNNMQHLAGRLSVVQKMTRRLLRVCC